MSDITLGGHLAKTISKFLRRMVDKNFISTDNDCIGLATQRTKEADVETSRRRGHACRCLGAVGLALGVANHRPCARSPP
jgi:hypothetical protein